MIEKFVEYLRDIKNYSVHTVSNYKKDIQEFESFMSSEHINNFKDVEYSHIRFYLMELYNKKYSKSTISRKLSSLRSFYKFLVNNGEVNDNPFILVSGPKKDKKLPKFLYVDEINKLFSVSNLTKPLGQRNRLILELLYATGIRVSELVNIKLCYIDVEGKTIDIIGKGNKERYVSFGEYALEIMELYIEDGRKGILKNKESDYLILNKDGRKITSRGIRLILDKLIKESSLDTHLSPHMLRHTFATHMLNNGADLLTVQELLGHENLSTTSIYTHVTDAHLRKMYNSSHPRAKKSN